MQDIYDPLFVKGVFDRTSAAYRCWSAGRGCDRSGSRYQGRSGRAANVERSGSFPAMVA